jgi:hypothetical protein
MTPFSQPTVAPSLVEERAIARCASASHRLCAYSSFLAHLASTPLVGSPMVTTFSPEHNTTYLTAIIANEAYERASNVTHANQGKRCKRLRHTFIAKFLEEYGILLEATKVTNMIKALDRRLQGSPQPRRNGIHPGLPRPQTSSKSWVPITQPDADNQESTPQQSEHTVSNSCTLCLSYRPRTMRGSLRPLL